MSAVQDLPAVRCGRIVRVEVEKKTLGGRAELLNALFLPALPFALKLSARVLTAVFFDYLLAAVLCSNVWCFFWSSRSA